MKRATSLLGWSLIAAAVPLLSGCFGAAAVGVGATALLVADRRPSETYVADEACELRTVSRANEKFGDKIHINATCYNHAVLLTGEVPDAATKAEIEKITATVPNVKSIANELLIAGPSTLGSRSNDAFITSKVKGRFIDAAKFSANLVKVVTEGGNVYLMGLVTRKEADDAVEIARTTGGVLKVVRVMEVVSDAEAKRLDNNARNQAAPAASANQNPVRKP